MWIIAGNVNKMLPFGARTPAELRDKGIVAVLGMHRSGTSAIAGMLADHGVELGPVSQQNRFNPRGNREIRELNRLHDRILERSGGAWWDPPSRTRPRRGDYRQRNEILRSIPGETIDGVPMNRLILTERARPHSLLVDASGRRFVNEAQNYNDLGRALLNFEPQSFSYPHVPAWLVFDSGYRRAHPLGPLAPDAPDPDWLARAGSVAALAETIGAPPAELEATVDRFNEGAARGEDPKEVAAWAQQELENVYGA